MNKYCPHCGERTNTDGLCPKWDCNTFNTIPNQNDTPSVVMRVIEATLVARKDELAFRKKWSYPKSVIKRSQHEIQELQEFLHSLECLEKEKGE